MAKHPVGAWKVDKFNAKVFSTPHLFQRSTKEFEKPGFMLNCTTSSAPPATVDRSPKFLAHNDVLITAYMDQNDGRNHITATWNYYDDIQHSLWAKETRFDSNEFASKGLRFLETLQLSPTMPSSFTVADTLQKLQELRILTESVVQIVGEYFYTIFDVVAASGNTLSSKYFKIVYIGFFQPKIVIFGKSDRYLGGWCDTYRFFWMLIFGILLQNDVQIDKQPKTDFLINFPPLFFALEVKNAEKVTLPQNVKKNCGLRDATIFVGIFYLDWYLV